MSDPLDDDTWYKRACLWIDFTATMPLKREHSQSSPTAIRARKIPRLLTQDLLLSSDPTTTATTVTASPVDPEHVPSAPQPTFVYHLPPAELLARLEEMTEQYEHGVDEASVSVNQLRRQVSVARRHVESTPSWEGPSGSAAVFGAAVAGGHDGVGKDERGDGAARDGVVEDGAARDGVVGDGTARDGVVEDGAARDSVVEDGAARDGMVGDGMARDGVVEDGAARDGAVGDDEGGAAIQADGCVDLLASGL